MPIQAREPDLEVDVGVNVKRFIEQAKKAAAEGSETELGTLDADLLQIAADCVMR